MGYTTRFTGEIHVNPTGTRQSGSIFGSSVGRAEWIVHSGPYALDAEAAAPDSSRSPADQPGLWSQWVPSEAGSHLVWDGHEKFYRSSAG